MTIALYFTTLALGIFIGIVIAVSAAIYLDSRDRETARRQKIHPSGRTSEEIDIPSFMND